MAQGKRTRWRGQKSRGEIWGALLEADGNSKIETTPMGEEAKEMRTKVLWTIVKDKEEMRSGRWTSTG